GAQRRMTLRRAFAPFQLGDEWIERTYAIYVRVRNEVECYADTTAALTRMAARYPLVSISNGTAELERIGLHGHFRFSVSASEVGVAKPAPDIFHHACERLGIAPEHVLHVGDDPLADVVGARDAGMRTVWLDRQAAAWQHEIRPDLEMADLGALANWLDRYSSPNPSPST
ncbi:MAG: HAD family hydrolase, partial [Dokdonella sp.]